jgi:large subunit ribosomal protein L15
MRYSLYEGGAVPLYRRLPKRGFNNKQFARRFDVVNVCDLERFEDGAQVGVEQLSQAGLISGRQSRVKILGDGELTKRLLVVAHKFSKSAEEKIVGCGGTATVMIPKVQKYVRPKKGAKSAASEQN